MDYLSQIINRRRSKKSLSALNIAGLSVCVAAALMVLFYVRFELSFDTFHHTDRIYRAESRLYEGGLLTDNWATTTFGHGPVMSREIPGIEQYVRVTAQDWEQEVTYGDRQFIEDSYCYTEPAFFDMFDFRIEEGVGERQLERPNTVVVARSAAHRYFGDQNPIGKMLTFKTPSSVQCFEVTGVMEDMPYNSHLRYDFLLSYSTIPEARREIWYIHGVYTYLRLGKEVDPDDVAEAFSSISANYRTAALRHKEWKIELIPLEDIHLTPRKSYEKEAKGSRIAVDILLVMTIALLLTGWVNALNLTIARYLERGREFGLRKIFGATGRQIITYGLLESCVVNFLALILAALLLAVMLPFVSRMVGCNFASDILTSPVCWGIVAAIYVAGVIIVGLYPAFLMTRIRPTDFMKGRMLHGRRGNKIRKLLMLVQFVASFILVSGTFAVMMQVDYMQSRSASPLFDRVVVLKYPSSTEDMAVRVADFKRHLERQPSVRHVSVSGAVPGVEVANYFTNRPYGSDASEVKLIQMFAVDYDYLTLYAPQFVCGRGFSEGYGNEHDKVVLNEEAVRVLGYTSAEDALGKQLAMEVVSTPLEVIGVVRDYQQQSFSEPYKPIIFFLKERVPIIATPYISVMLDSEVEQESVDAIERIYKSYFPMAAFSYFRLSDFNYNLYKSDRNFSRIFTCASLLAVFVACLGLWIMTLFSTMSRMKEIGIRKVLGAGKKSLFMVLTRELMVLTLIAAAIGTPVSVILMNEWLRSYAFHITLPWWIFLVSFGLIATVGLFTVVRQIWRALRVNPITILRNE